MSRCCSYPAQWRAQRGADVVLVCPAHRRFYTPADGWEVVLYA